MVQAIARSVLAELGGSIGPSDTERSIAARATTLLADRGIHETWYYDCPALVLLGSRSCLSVSGRDYSPGDEQVGRLNVVTVDLSPLRDGVWGDCARSFAIEDGRWTNTPATGELERGIQVEALLHQAIRKFAEPNTSFEDLFEFGNAEIERHGFENLDFLGNLGHSIALRREERCYVERGNTRRLDSIACFTFEPHVRAIGGTWGFKHEEIYFFDTTQRLSTL
jgi:Xaa-Pro aminopeptidase